MGVGVGEGVGCRCRFGDLCGVGDGGAEFRMDKWYKQQVHAWLYASLSCMCV